MSNTPFEDDYSDEEPYDGPPDDGHQSVNGVQDDLT